MPGERMPGRPAPRRPSSLEMIGAAAAVLGGEACATENALGQAVQQDTVQQEREHARLQPLSPEAVQAVREALAPWGNRQDMWRGLSVLRFALVEPGHYPTYYITERIGTATDHYQLMRLIDGIRQTASTLYDRVEQGTSYGGDDDTEIEVNRLSRLVSEVRALPASDRDALAAALVQITQQERGDVDPQVAGMIARNLLPEEDASAGYRIPTVSEAPHAAPIGESSEPVQLHDTRENHHTGRHHRHHRP